MKVKIYPKSYNLEDMKKMSERERERFSDAMRTSLILGQITCLAPICNKFSWFSIRVIVAIIALAGEIFMTVISMMWIYSNGISISKGGVVFFFGCASISMLLFIRLAFKWPELMRHWSQVENNFIYLPHLKLKCTGITVVLLTFSAIEYLFELLYGMMTCYSGQEILRLYAQKKFPQFFEIMPYSTWHALPVMFIGSVALLGNSFTDQLLILTTMALGDLFQSYTTKMKALQGKRANPNTWKVLRSDYIQLYDLTKSLDDCVSHQVLMSCALYVYLILVEMHHGLISMVKEKGERIYLLISFCVSLLKICTICLCSIRVHEQSKLPLKVLYSVPPSSYCNEVQLLTAQVLKSEATITGSGFFYIKRRFMLTVSI
ncbi:gustatory receptor for sugar taste 64f-like [Lycorma delicatula]|uniref:gustatory receptor for sugar taste 64f-like n=1 Tax=Lycorma delicatula TaxID=130591 RepID=UPI003F50EC14